MKKFNKKILFSIVILFVFGLFGSVAVFSAGPPVVDLGSTNNFAILSKTGITNVPTSIITGNVGSSPITGASIGLTCAEVTGKIYSTDATGPMPCRITGPSLLTNAINDMQAAYTDIATRTPATGANLNIGGGTVSTQTLAPGLYTWTTAVTITGDITLSGDATDVWIFQVNGTLDIDAAKSIILSGGATASNVFWQTTETVNLMANSNFKGNILSQTNIAMRSGASLDGRAFAQTEVSLIANTVSIPTDSILTSLRSTLNIIKTVVNDNGGNKSASDFTINVTGTGVSVSSFPGEENPGTKITLDAGAYSIDENNDLDYLKSLSSDCSGTIAEGEDKTCIITNNDKQNVSSGSGSTSGSGIIYGCKDPTATNYNYFSSSDPSLCQYTNSQDTITTTTVINQTSNIVTPRLPKTGFPSQKNNSWYTITYSYILNIIR